LSSCIGGPTPEFGALGLNSIWKVILFICRIWSHYGDSKTPSQKEHNTEQVKEARHQSELDVSNDFVVIYIGGLTSIWEGILGFTSSKADLCHTVSFHLKRFDDIPQNSAQMKHEIAMRWNIVVKLQKDDHGDHLSNSNVLMTI